MHKLSIPLLCIVLLASCSQPASDVVLTLAPSAIKDCGADTTPVALTVHWDASKAVPNHGKIKLWINGKPVDQGIFSDYSKGTLWRQGNAKGSATTGAWMYPGSRITVTNAANGAVLSRLDVPAAPCS